MGHLETDRRLQNKVGPILLPACRIDIVCSGEALRSVEEVNFRFEQRPAVESEGAGETEILEVTEVARDRAKFFALAVRFVIEALAIVGAELHAGSGLPRGHEVVRLVL